ncbi:MAG TPA: hemerythrin domain-containing protein [Methylomirabilota bacterium]|nr:hemerythrin domain-containing protein [Methylomirabilota bacterium]
MTTRTPTELLREEHRIILAGLDVLEGAAVRLRGGGGLPERLWPSLLAFFKAFADRNHHAKEENALFPAMIKAGVPGPGGPIDVMLEEHEQGRGLLRAMDAAGAPAERATLAERYVTLLREHIDKENGIVFPLADAVLDPPAQSALQRDFDAVEAELGIAASPDAAERTVKDLAASLAG